MIDYYSFWNINEPPFEDNNNPKFFYKSTDHYEALERLKYVVNSQSMNLGLLSGEIGTGKTITKMVLISELKKSNMNNIVVNIDSTSFTYNEILTEVLSQILDTDAMKLPKKRYYLFKMLQKYIEDELLYTKGLIYIFLDEAQKISAKDLDLLKDLTNINYNYFCPIKLILIGQPAIMKSIRKLPQVDQRIGMRFHLNHMSSDDTSSYVEYRLKVSGAKQRIFTADALRVIYRKTSGIPREINRACKIAMDVASAEKAKLIDKDTMEMVFTDLAYHGREM